MRPTGTPRPASRRAEPPPAWARLNNHSRNDEGPACGEPFIVPVGIVYLCSTKSATPVGATHIREIVASISTSSRELEPRVKRGWNRLNAHQRAEVASRYESGDSTTQLANDYGVAKSTIIGILREKSVAVRRQPLTPEQVSEAARLYESGLSLSQVATKVRVNQETMRVAIVAAGVALRPPTGSNGTYCEPGAKRSRR